MLGSRACGLAPREPCVPRGDWDGWLLPETWRRGLRRAAAETALLTQPLAAGGGARALAACGESRLGRPLLAAAEVTPSERSRLLASDELWGAEGSRPLLVAIFEDSLSVPVGSGTLLFDPQQLVATFVLTTDASGCAGLTTGVLATAVGMTFAEQWFVLPSGAPTTPWGVDFSDGLVFMVE